MSVPVPLTGITAASPATPPAGPASVGGGEGFARMLAGFVRDVNADQQAGSQAIRDLATGRTDNIQDVVLSVAEAEMSFQFFMEVRNRVLDAWNDLMRMQF